MKSLLKKMILSSVAFAALLGATPKAEATVQDVKNLCVDSVQTCARSAAQQIPNIGNVMRGTVEMAAGIVYTPLMEQGFKRACQGVSDIVNNGYNEYFGFCTRHTMTDKMMRFGLTAGAFYYGGFLFAAGTALAALKNNSADLLYHHLPAAAATRAIGNALVPLALSTITGEGSAIRTAVEGAANTTADSLQTYNATIPYAETAAKMVTSSGLRETVMFGPIKFFFGRRVKPKVESSIKEFSRT
jgi:hypothetical protein